MFRIICLAVLAAAAMAQTQVDLRLQSKGVDFSGASATKPMSTGAALPGTCTSGQMFFVTNAPAGQNLYGCVANNVWALEAGGGTSGSGVTVENSGAVVGTSSLLNFTTGTGALYAISTAGQTIGIQASADTAVLSTLARNQSGSPWLCASASGSAVAYTCSMSPTLSIYTTGMTINWRPDVNGSGGPTTINIDSLGTRPVKLADGATDPGPGDISASRLYEIWFDGVNFRLLGTAQPLGVLGEAMPACGASVRGRLWFAAGAAGVKDSLSVCAKDTSNVYAWRVLY